MDQVSVNEALELARIRLNDAHAAQLGALERISTIPDPQMRLVSLISTSAIYPAQVASIKLDLITQSVDALVSERRL